MSFFRALKKIGSAVVDTALLPVDAVIAPFEPFESRDTSIERRIKKIARELQDAHEETFKDKP